MTRPAFIPAPEVARLLGLPDAAAFLRRRAGLQDHHAFPPPMPTSVRPLLWKADEVQAWADRFGNAPVANDLTLDPAVLADAMATGKLHLLHMARTA